MNCGQLRLQLKTDSKLRRIHGILKCVVALRGWPFQGYQCHRNEWCAGAMCICMMYLCIV